MIDVDDFGYIETEAVRLIKLLKQNKTVSRIDNSIVIHDVDTDSSDTVVIKERDTFREALCKVIECLIQNR